MTTRSPMNGPSYAGKAPRKALCGVKGTMGSPQTADGNCPLEKTRWPRTNVCSTLPVTCMPMYGVSCNWKRSSLLAKGLGFWVLNPGMYNKLVSKCACSNSPILACPYEASDAAANHTSVFSTDRCQIVIKDNGRNPGQMKRAHS